MPLFTQELEFSDDYPTIEPSLKLDFANARALDPRITFARASTATYVGRDGLIKYAGDDEARFDHDPVTGGSLGLLIEESRTNILKGTSTAGNFTGGNGYWTIGGTRSTQGSNQLAPDGTISAFSNAYNGTSGDAAIYYSENGNSDGSQAPTVNSTLYTLSVFAKVPSGNNYIQGVYVRTYSPEHSAIFNLKTGTIIGTNEGTTTNRMEAYPNGWYRCSITFTSGTDGNQGVQFYLTNSSNGTALNDPSANGEALYYWAPQLEAGSFPTSYIPTSGASATRATDIAKITGTNFTDFYNQTEGTIFFNYKNLSTDTSTIRGVWGLENSVGPVSGIRSPQSGATRIRLFYNNNFSSSTSNLFLIDTNYKKGVVAYNQTENRLMMDGTSDFVSATHTNDNTIVALSIGSRTINGDSPLGGHIKSFSYYPKRLTNTQLQTLTQ